MTSYMDQETATNLDKYLMGEDVGYSIDQLMEIAGLGVAEAVNRYVTQNGDESSRELAILCGPGNNGGDGLVAARYLTLFGKKVFVVLPKVKRDNLFTRLLSLLHHCDVEVITNVDQEILSRIQNSSYVIDALFGFGFKGELREPFLSLITTVFCSSNKVPKIISVDVPSGWSVNDGPQSGSPAINPDCIISLTAPKKCLLKYKGEHYLAGRFVPIRVAEKFKLQLPEFTGSEMVVKLN